MCMYMFRWHSVRAAPLGAGHHTHPCMAGSPATAARGRGCRAKPRPRCAASHRQAHAPPLVNTHPSLPPPLAGVAVYSRRAGPLAAWTNALELSGLGADTDRAFLILDTGVSQRWRYGAYRRTPESTEEAQAWEAAKQAVGWVDTPSLPPCRDVPARLVALLFGVVQ
jgi:hypothetical protein